MDVHPEEAQRELDRIKRRMADVGVAVTEDVTETETRMRRKLAEIREGERR